jgi:hypothetical protein
MTAFLAAQTIQTVNRAQQMLRIHDALLSVRSRRMQSAAKNRTLSLTITWVLPTRTQKSKTTFHGLYKYIC